LTRSFVDGYLAIAVNVDLGIPVYRTSDAFDAVVLAAYAFDALVLAAYLSHCAKYLLQ
jgi:hypothetical protein